MLLDGNVNPLGKGVASGLLLLGIVVAVFFLRARVTLTDDMLISSFGFSRREVSLKDIKEVELAPGNLFGLTIPWLRLVDDRRVALTQIADGRQGKEGKATGLALMINQRLASPE